MNLPLVTCPTCLERDARARVWLWCAYWAGREEDALSYAWPRRAGSEEEIARLAEARQGFIEKAEKVSPGSSRRCWRDAVDAFLGVNETARCASEAT